MPRYLADSSCLGDPFTRRQIAYAWQNLRSAGNQYITYQRAVEYLNRASMARLQQAEVNGRKYERILPAGFIPSNATLPTSWSPPSTPTGPQYTQVEPPTANPNPWDWPTDPGNRDVVTYLCDEYDRRRADSRVNQARGIWFMPGLLFLRPTAGTWDRDDYARAVANPRQFLTVLRQAAGRGQAWGRRSWPLADSVPPEIEQAFPGDPKEVWNWMWRQQSVGSRGTFPVSRTSTGTTPLWIQAYMQIGAYHAARRAADIQTYDAAVAQGHSTAQANRMAQEAGARAGQQAERSAAEAAYDDAQEELGKLSAENMESARQWSANLRSEAEGVRSVLDPLGLGSGGVLGIPKKMTTYLIWGGVALGALTLGPPLIRLITPRRR